MVVRSAGPYHTVGEVRLEAVISNRSFVVFREKRPFDQTPSVEFILPPASAPLWNILSSIYSTPYSL